MFRVIIWGVICWVVIGTSTGLFRSAGALAKSAPMRQPWPVKGNVGNNSGLLPNDKAIRHDKAPHPGPLPRGAREMERAAPATLGKTDRAASTTLGKTERAASAALSTRRGKFAASYSPCGGSRIWSAAARRRLFLNTAARHHKVVYLPRRVLSKTECAASPTLGKVADVSLMPMSENSSIDHEPSPDPPLKQMTDKQMTDEQMTNDGFWQESFLQGIRFFQIFISPADGDRCPMSPSCSQYAMEAIRTYGPWRGLILASDRLLRCGREDDYPLIHKQGVFRYYDPLGENVIWH
jgi:putative membrane protein insertion efficiency factor